jgi:hypothetical protein
LFGGGATTLGGFAAVAGPLALFAAPLIAGAIIYAKNKARQAAEKQRDSLSKDYRTQVYEILWEAQDPQRGLTVAQARTKFNAIETAYKADANKIKDGKTRRNAILWWDNDVKGQIWPMIEKAAKASEAAKKFQGAFVPTFDTGGWVQPSSMRFVQEQMQLIKVRPGEQFIPPSEQRALWMQGGKIPGQDKGHDDSYMYAPVGSRIIPKSEFATGGTVGQTSSSTNDASSNTGNAAPIVVKVAFNFSLGKEDASKLYVTGASSEDGRRVQAEAIIEDVKKNGMDGVLGPIILEMFNKGLIGK